MEKKSFRQDTIKNFEKISMIGDLGNATRPVWFEMNSVTHKSVIKFWEVWDKIKTNILS